MDGVRLEECHVFEFVFQSPVPRLLGPLEVFGNLSSLLGQLFLYDGEPPLLLGSDDLLCLQPLYFGPLDYFHNVVFLALVEFSVQLFELLQPLHPLLQAACHRVLQRVRAP